MLSTYCVVDTVLCFRDRVLLWCKLTSSPWAQVILLPQLPVLASVLALTSEVPGVLGNLPWGGGGFLS